ncbi:MAG: arginase family protein, partial [Bacteroidetes bacterium]|nr:arginase family protein [Bacteroidota bacterium]
HSITYPILRAYSRKYSQLTVVQLDAHPDLYDELDGNRLSHACPFARVMEEKLISRLMQIGVRTMNPHQRHQAERFLVEIVEARLWSLEALATIDGPVYLTLDLDVLDPAFAPGVSHHEPGGLTTRDVLGIIQKMPGKIVGADIVEYNPDRDPVGVTAMVGAKFLKEIVARMLG